MIPELNKTYFIAYKGEFEFDGYMGTAECTSAGGYDEGWGKTLYEFTLLDAPFVGNAFFSEEDVVAEANPEVLKDAREKGKAAGKRILNALKSQNNI